MLIVIVAAALPQFEPISQQLALAHIRCIENSRGMIIDTGCLRKTEFDNWLKTFSVSVLLDEN